MITTRWSSAARLLVPARWLLAPVVGVALLALVALAISSDDRSTEPIQLDASPNESDGDPEPSGTAPAAAEPTGDDGPTGEEPSGEEPIESGGVEAASVAVSAPGGELGIALGAGPPVLQPSVGGAAGPTTELGPDALDGALGLRLGADGALEPVDVGSAIASSDIVAAPEPSPAPDGPDGTPDRPGQGVDLLRPDGNRVEIRTGGDTPSGIEVTSVDEAGGTETLTPDGDGRIDLGGGLALQLPAEAPVPPTPDGAEAEAEDDGGGLGIRWLVLALLAAVMVGALILRRLRSRSTAIDDRPPAIVEPPFEIGPIDAFAATLRADPDPARAIRLAFHAASRGMGTLPPRERIETPAEWHQRVVGAQPHFGPPLGALCNQFAAVRFAPVQPSAADREEAVASLLQVHDLANPPTAGGPGSSPQLSRAGSR